MQVLKFVMSKHGISTIKMPSGSVLLRVGLQAPEIVLWALCEPKNPQVDHKLLAVFSGEEVPPQVLKEDMKFISTLQLRDQQPNGQIRELVVHFFDLGEGQAIFVPGT